MFFAETITLTAPEASLLSARQVVALPRFVITPIPGFGRLSNSLVSNNSETDVQGGGMQLTVTLVGDSWAPAIGQRGSGAADSLTKQVLRAFISAQDEDGGWNAVVQKALAYTELSYVKGDAITLTLPSFPAYDLLKAETISCNLPPVAVRSGQEIFAGIGDAQEEALQISANTGTIRLSGSLFAASNETTLRSVTTVQVVITLTGDTWTQGVGQQDESGEGASSQLLRGFTSLQDSTTGWNSIVRPGIPQGNVERTDDFTVTISVDQFAAYDISAPETIEVVVPPIAVSSAQVVQAPSFVILPIKGGASLSGSFIDAPSEELLCCEGGLRFSITLTGDSWSEGVDVDAAASEALERGFRSLNDSPSGSGWNNVILPALVARNSSSITRLSDTEILVHLPPLAAYSITEPETLGVAIPASAAASKQRLVPAPAKGLVIAAAASVCVLSGALHPSTEEGALRDVAGNTLFITLLGDTFTSSVALPGTASDEMLAGIKSSSDLEPYGWAQIVAPALEARHIRWDARNASTVALTIPSFVLYDVASP